MVEDFKQEVMIEDDDDNIEEYTDMMYKHHDKYIVWGKQWTWKKQQ